jgi:hypothetical protein
MAQNNNIIVVLYGCGTLRKTLNKQVFDNCAEINTWFSEEQLRLKRGIYDICNS